MTNNIIKESKTPYFDVLLALSRYDHRTHKGITKFASKHNWHLNCDLILSGTLPSYWQGDGVISLLTEEDKATADFVLQRKVPFVDLSIMRPDIKAPRVSADHMTIGATAAEYFLEKGFRNFAFFSMTDDNVSNSRKDGFYKGISSRVNYFQDWTLNKNKINNVNLHKSISQLLKDIPLPLAIFCNRDNDASLVLGVCLQKGLGIPEQVAILGVDNNELITNSLKVPISSVNHDVEALGYEGAKLLHNIMQNGVPESLLSKPKLIRPSGITSRRSTDCLAVDNETVRTAIKHINYHFTQPYYTVEKTADFCCVSRRHLDNLFQKELGYTMHNMLNNNRLRLAQNALITSNDSVAKISASCGFTRVQYFNNSFKKYTGKTPGEFRNEGQIETK